MSTEQAAPITGPPRTIRDRPIESAAGTNKMQPVVRWAILGGLMLAFMTYVLTKWVTGPSFHSVPTGATEPSDLMKVCETVFIALSIIADGFLIHRLVIRPWRREKRVSTNGLFLLCFAVMYFQDPFGDAGGYWFVYNSWIPNMGSWASSLPGWLPASSPGHELVEPVIMMLPGYLYLFLVPTMLGLWVIRTVKARWPRSGIGTQLAAVFVAMCVFDFVLEGLIWMPLGFYVYPSAPGPFLFAGTYHQFPIIEMPLIAFLCTSLVALRYFTDDKGHTIAERGIDEVRTTPGRKVLLRLLALIAATQLVFFLTYNIEVYHFGVHSKNWPQSIQERSYFLDGLCGAGSDIACPTSAVPWARGRGDAASRQEISITPDGKLVVPPGATLPAGPVPFITKG
jgi:hypothetical protein